MQSLSFDPRILNGALDRDPQCMRQLVDYLTPVVQARVARALLQQASRHRPRNIREEVKDLTQEIFLYLLRDNGKGLRAWRSDGGLSLLNFVGLIAHRRALSFLRSKRRNPWTEDPTEDEQFVRMETADRTAESGPEQLIASRQQLQRVWEHISAQLSPRSLILFELLLVQESSIEEVSAATGMSASAIYSWRNRLKSWAQRSLKEECHDA